MTGAALAGIDHWPVGTVAAAVIGADGVVETRGDIHHPFVLASVTKPLAVVTALVATEEGALELEDPVLGDLLAGATVRHLMAHASGLASDRLIRAAAPGARRIYSNAGIDVLGTLVAQATTMGFEEYFAQAVAAPLGLSATTLGEHPSRDGVSTVADLSRFVGELIAPTGLLHPQTLTAATSVQFPGLRGVLPGYGPQNPNDWGLGFEIKATKVPHWTGPSNSAATYGHFGQSGTMLWVDPTRRLGLIAMADRLFDVWAAAAWPELSDAVIARYG